MKVFQNRNQNSSMHFTLLIFLVFVCEISSDIYAPAMATLIHSFQTSASIIALTMSVNLIGIATSAIFYGPLSDFYGRRPIILSALSIFIVSTVLASRALNIEQLIFFRFIQGIGAGVAPVMAYACPRDLYEGATLAKKLSRMSMITAFSPAIGPVIGAFIIESYHWSAAFSFIAIGAFFLWGMLFFLFKETREANSQSQPVKKIRLSSIGYSYVQVLSNRSFRLFCGAAAAIFSVLWMELANLPVIYVDGMGLTTVEYSLLFSVLVIVYILGCFFNQLLMSRLKVWTIISLGMILQISSLLAVSIAYIGFSAGPYLLQLLKLPGSLGFAFLLSNIVSKALSNFQSNYGVASAVLACIHMMTGALTIYLVGLSYDGGLLGLIAFSSVSLIFGLGFLSKAYFLSKKNDCQIY